MNVERGVIISRSLTGHCPNCGAFGMFKHWFRLNRHCTGCEMPLEKEDSGFYFSTTSIGYVLAIIVVIIPICVLVVKGVLAMWTAVIIGCVGSVIFTHPTLPTDAQLGNYGLLHAISTRATRQQ